jgi:hypothetical protein
VQILVIATVAAQTEVHQEIPIAAVEAAIGHPLADIEAAVIIAALLEATLAAAVQGVPREAVRAAAEVEAEADLQVVALAEAEEIDISSQYFNFMVLQ